jgi:hypothetical protein
MILDVFNWNCKSIHAYLQFFEGSSSQFVLTYTLYLFYVLFACSSNKNVQINIEV